MHRPGSDPQDMQPTDFLCDFCERPWSERTPFIEGHHGSCICGDCLSLAIVERRGGGTASSGSCTMCLEHREDLRWRSPRRDASICDRCIDQATTVFGKDRSIDWSPPAA
ncbi:MAG: hypothetical protein FJ253_05295 [Phycisphaerae bacterium]|nr:hypothetical protein [Phycisphaerae bacterium]